MEDTAYNRKIVDQIRAINQRYIKDQERTGYMLEDMPITRNTVGRGADFEGGGILSGLLGSIGLGKQGGAYMRGAGSDLGYDMFISPVVDTVKAFTSSPLVQDGMKLYKDIKGSGRAKKRGAGFLDTLESVAPLALMALGKPKKGGISTGGKRGRPRKMAGIHRGTRFGPSGQSCLKRPRRTAAGERREEEQALGPAN